MGKYKGYSGNQHLRTDMDHERRLIHDAKDDIYDEDRKLRDRKSAGHKDGVDVDTKDTGEATPVYNPAVADATVMDDKRVDPRR